MKDFASDFFACVQYVRERRVRMPAIALRVQEFTVQEESIPTLRVHERTFRESIETFVRATCCKYRVKRANVEDIEQEAFAQIMASIASFQPEKGEFDKWSRGVARNVILRHLRDAKRYSENFSEYHSNMDEHPAPAPSPERCVQRLQARWRLSSAADGLSEKQAEILMLHAVDGLSHKDIGSELEITEGASQKCYQRARNRMAQCIAKDAHCVLPPVETSCNDVSAPNGAASQWRDPGKWSHYSGQIAAAIIAFLMFVTSNSAVQQRASITGKIPTGSYAAMYQHDKHIVALDKLVAYRAVPMAKPEPASLPSVRAVPLPKRFVGKPTPVKLPVPTYEPAAPPILHRQPVRSIEH